MDIREILTHVDHTLLKATTTWPEIQSLCDEAIEWQTASVCVPPTYVKRIADAYGDHLTICTVIGFPLGYQTTEVKIAEAVQAAAEGAKEIDMVVNLGDVKDGNFGLVEAEIRGIREALPGKILKVIIETCYLSLNEKVALCGAVTAAGADFIKTSTGFGSAGASLEDIRLFREHIGAEVRIKAAGGIRTKEEMEAFLEAGAERIGASAAVKIARLESFSSDY
ncbi:MAG: deoxyribose-phosphate aldolase [Clostridia bacterium]|nr:deoxyribose-phosphate aldolase [Clostridia bacterium]